MNILILVKTLNFLMVIALAASTVMAETAGSNQDSQQQISQSQDQNGEELPDDDMLTDED